MSGLCDFDAAKALLAPLDVAPAFVRHFDKSPKKFAVAVATYAQYAKPTQYDEFVWTLLGVDGRDNELELASEGPFSLNSTWNYGLV